ncbi:hypothetical protein AB0N36_45980, partial [Streptomyces acidicola]
MQERQWITARRSELEAIAEELAEQLQEVQAEREELAITERVLNRLDEQARGRRQGLSLRYRRRWPGGQSCPSRTAATRPVRARCLA